MPNIPDFAETLTTNTTSHESVLIAHCHQLVAIVTAFDIYYTVGEGIVIFGDE